MNNRKQWRKRLLMLSVFVVLLSAFTACTITTPHLEPTVLLISFDGFRPDYLTRTETPNLDYLIQNGVKADSLIPVFPSSTFPNHYSIVTGLYPEHHGIVSNVMYDPEFAAWFRIGTGSQSAQDGRWYEGEPIWVTVETQHQRAATMFWPGSDAAIKNVRPSYYHVFDDTFPNTRRVEQILAWLDLPDNQRPTFFALYFSDTDTAGHTYGPQSEKMNTAIKELDTRIGQLLQGLRERKLETQINIIILSDHGMAPVSRERMIFLDDYIDLTQAHFLTWSPITALEPLEGMKEPIYNALVHANPHLTVYQKESIPDRLHYRAHRRIPSLIAIADEGWSVAPHLFFNENPNAFRGGVHGYDPLAPSMHGIFIAAGPQFNKGTTVQSFQNIHIYELLCHILHLTPATNDGNFDSLPAGLKTQLLQKQE